MYSKVLETMKSSLTFQVSLHLGSYLLGFFAILEVAMMVYKYIGRLASHPTHVSTYNNISNN